MRVSLKRALASFAVLITCALLAFATVSPAKAFAPTAALPIGENDPTIAPPGDGSHFFYLVGKQKFSWGAAEGALGYLVRINGSLIATLEPTATTYVYNHVLGPRDVVEIVTVGVDSVESTATVLQYSKTKRMVLGTIDFEPNSAVLTYKSLKKLRSFANYVALHGFTEVFNESYTKFDKAYSDAYRLKLSRLRSATVSTFLKADLGRYSANVQVTRSGRGTSTKRSSDLSTR